MLHSVGSTLSLFKTNEMVYFDGQFRRQVLALVCHVPGFSPETSIIELGAKPIA
ncbi:MAG TPA: hypothetical protein VIQ51_05480 [Chryseosolibacter sp.]